MKKIDYNLNENIDDGQVDIILSTRSPVRVEIVSSAEKTPLLAKDLDDLLKDTSNYCEFTSFVDDHGQTLVKIECEISEDDKERVWDLVRFKHKRLLTLC